MYEIRRASPARRIGSGSRKQRFMETRLAARDQDHYACSSLDPGVTECQAVMYLKP
jgi:hypothetical protein